jgi:hypothetical protein
MNRGTLQFAIEEARRFLRLAKELDADAKRDEFYFGVASKRNGAVKRASMDLSRALSNLRRPG